jgi:hypothetical protein
MQAVLNPKSMPQRVTRSVLPHRITFRRLAGINACPFAWRSSNGEERPHPSALKGTMNPPIRVSLAQALAFSTILLAPHIIGAQGTSPRPEVAASGRVSTSVAFDGRLIGNVWLNRSTAHSGPALLLVDYGQPHARGRTIYGELVPFGQVWRLGANMATHLQADLNIRIGDLPIPRGLYTLYLIPHSDGAELIVNRATGQWGTEYDVGQDVGRVPMRARELPEPVESLTITLAPDFPQAEGELPLGTLTISWGTIEYTIDWQGTWP